jgi:dihydrofolate reductase
MKCSVFIATSLDGYIAGPDGDISWLEKPEYKSSPFPGLSYDDFISTVDAIIMGRNTFEKVLTFGFWPYDSTTIYVLSSRKLTIPEHLREKAFHINESPQNLVNQLSEKGLKQLYIDGGITIQRFLSAGLIDEITITIVPVILGSGIPLFGNTDQKNDLQLNEVDRESNGFVQLRYSVIKNSP